MAFRQSVFKNMELMDSCDSGKRKAYWTSNVECYIKTLMLHAVLVSTPIQGIQIDEKVLGACFRCTFTDGRIFSISYPTTGYGMAEILEINEDYSNDTERYETIQEVRDKLIKLVSVVPS